MNQAQWIAWLDAHDEGDEMLRVVEEAAAMHEDKTAGVITMAR